jgi:SAM-dependent methyltransferase
VVHEDTPSNRAPVVTGPAVADAATVTANGSLPYPPLELANRVGSLADSSDPYQYYDKLGRSTHNGIMDLLPANWAFSGKRVLDFGCGAGRTLRHFAAEAAEAEFWGCDIDEASIRWMEEQLCPPFRVFVNETEPPLDQPDSSFDLIWAISVFTHLTYNWSRWLVELHRVLKPDGLLLVTFMGRGMSQEIAGESWDDDSFGMNVIKYGQSWDLGGPMVLHSPWWIEEHWGRAFEIVSLVPDGFAEKPWLDHGCVLMRRREQAVDPEELERIASGDARETRALLHNIEQLHSECQDLRTGIEYLESKQDEGLEQRRQLEAQVQELERVRDGALAECERAIAERELALAEQRKSHQQALELRQQAAELHRTTAAEQRQAASARERSLNSARRLLAIEENLAQSKARIFALEEVIDEMQPRLERADRVMAAMKASVSWRVTAPLRALKRGR